MNAAPGSLDEKRTRPNWEKLLVPFPPTEQEFRSGFRLIYLATQWGDEGTIEDFCARIKVAGYDGAELWISSDQSENDRIARALTRYELEFGITIGCSIADPVDHLRNFTDMLETTERFPVRPLFVNCHSGHDFYSEAQADEFFAATDQFVRRTGIPTFHETHRGRLLYAAPVAHRALERRPELRLTFDVSHWCTVSESLLEDQAATLALAIDRTDHLHVRVGHPNGPQVADPRDPQWAEALAAHVAWWDRIVAAKKRAGSPLTMLVETGPPPYMPTHPGSGRPIADAWQINLMIKQFLQHRYS